MSVLIDLKQLTTSEKLQLMEALWHELTDSDLISPDWHGDVLAERDRLVESGEDHFVDWEIAKQELRRELP